MVIFKKSKKGDSQANDNSEGPPQLPELPKLPEIPNNDYSKENSDNYESNQLPSFPQNNLGDQLSQNTIKEAVSGEKEDEEDSWADEFDQYPEEDQMMSTESLEEPPEPTTRNYNQSSFEIPREYQKNNKKEPVFVRLDKFEDGMKTFEKLKEKTMDIEKLLKEIKKEKEEEEKEIENWEKELESMKSKIESLNKSIFSKIE